MQMTDCNNQSIRELRQVLADADCLADEAAVQRAIAAIAEKLSADVGRLLPVILCVMKGGLVFSGHLLPKLDFPFSFDYVHATRYSDGTNGGEIVWKAAPTMPLAGRHVVLLDDILDVGATLDAIASDCLRRGAVSVRTVVLVEKLHERKIRPGIKADYACLTMPDRYLFGYGMDYQGWWRNAPGIYALKEPGA